MQRTRLMAVHEQECSECGDIFLTDADVVCPTCCGDVPPSRDEIEEREENARDFWADVHINERREGEV